MTESERANLIRDIGKISGALPLVIEELREVGKKQDEISKLVAVHEERLNNIPTSKTVKVYLGIVTSLFAAATAVISFFKFGG